MIIRALKYALNPFIYYRFILTIPVNMKLYATAKIYFNLENLNLELENGVQNCAWLFHKHDYLAVFFSNIADI
jgi:hypothetical protein